MVLKSTPEGDETVNYHHQRWWLVAVAPRRCDRADAVYGNLVEQPTLNGFNSLFSLLLPLDIFAYLVFVQADGADTVPSRPEVTPPVPAPQSLVLAKQPDGHFSFQVAHEIRHRILGRNGDNKMDMVRLHVEFQHLNRIFLPTKPLDLLSRVLSYIACEHTVPVLRTKHDMVLALVNRMRQPFEPGCHRKPPSLFDSHLLGRSIVPLNW